MTGKTEKQPIVSDSQLAPPSESNTLQSQQQRQLFDYFFVTYKASKLG